MMHRKFIAIILGAAIAVTGLTTAPARAGDNDLLKIIGGVAAIAIIGTAIAKHKDRKDRENHVARQNNYHVPKPKAKHHGHWKHGNKHYGDKHHTNRGHQHGKADRHHRNDIARPLPKRVQRKLLPASCKIRARNHHGNFVGYSNWCLQRKFAHARSLPGQCLNKARVLHNNKRAPVYSSSCLNRYGYTDANY